MSGATSNIVNNPAHTTVIDRNPLSVAGLLLGLVIAFAAGIITAAGFVILALAQPNRLEMESMEYVYTVIGSMLAIGFGVGTLIVTSIYLFVRIMRLRNLAFARRVVVLATPRQSQMPTGLTAQVSSRPARVPVPALAA